MNDFVKHVLHDIAIWSALFVAVFMPEPYGTYGENFISFMGVFALVVGVTMLLVCKKMAADIAPDPTRMVSRSKFHKMYTKVSSIVEIIIVVSLGWYWVASGWLVMFLASTILRDEIDKLRAES